MIALCKKIPLRQGKPLDFVIGEKYVVSQMGHIFAFYEPKNGEYRITDIRLGYRQFKECFIRV